MVSKSNRSAVNRQFERRIVQHGERLLIESTCRYCGAVIVGSVTEKLSADENGHSEKCQTAKPYAEQPVSS